jgi:hypothetical protein
MWFRNNVDIEYCKRNDVSVTNICIWFVVDIWIVNSAVLTTNVYEP